MEPSRSGSDRLQGLRQRAEELLNAAKSDSSFPNAQTLREILRQLGAHQAELEMQNADLRANERRYRGLFEATDEAMALYETICDERGNLCDYRFLDMNPAYERLTGLERASLLGGKLSEVLANEAPEWIRLFGQVARSGNPVPFQKHSVTNERDLEGVACCLGPGQFASLFRDTTDGKQAERSLRESEERFRSLVESAPEAIFVQRQGRFAYVNPAMLRLLGASQLEELLRTDFMDRVALECRQAVRERLGRQRETGEAAPLVEQVWVRLDGSRVQVETTGVVLRFQGSDAHLVFARDITQRKRAEEALKESEKHFRDLAELLPQTVFEADAQGYLTFVNRAAYGSFRYAEDELIREVDCVGLIAAEDRTRGRANIERVMAGEDIGLTEYTAQRKDGSTFPALVHSAPIRVNGKCTGITGFLIDISAQKKSERDLLAYQEQLRGLARQLCSAEERQRRQVAEGLHDDVSQSIGALSLQLGVLSGTSLPPAQMQALAEARELIRSVSLAVRTLTFQLCPPMLHESGIAPALAWLVEEFRRKSPLRFDFVEDGNVPGLSEEARAFVFRAARELVTNAVKHASARKVSLRLCADGRGARLLVEDDGVGFDPAAADLVSSTGEGFGLFSIRERIRGLGGEVLVDSAPGQGTRITLVVPSNQSGG